jgi:AcrR family transcriptional regulator
MPPPINFSQDTILNEAVEIVRKEGLQALTARKIAQNLGCSTQPVYSAFGSMQELQEAVLRRVKAYALHYLLQGPKDEEPFLAIGLQYFRFAQEEQELFKLFFLSPHAEDPEQDIFTPPLLVERMKLDQHLQNLDEATLKRLLSNMWIYTHGLTTLSYASAQTYSEEFARERLMEMGEILITWEQFQQKGINLHELGMKYMQESTNDKKQE